MTASQTTDSQGTGGHGSSFGAGLSVKIETNVGSGGASLTGGMVEKDIELNLRDLGSSEDDENMSAGPSGGCTGEP